MKDFLWRGWKDLIACKQKLAQHGVEISNLYDFCQAENILHVVWSCPIAHSLWLSSSEVISFGVSTFVCNGRIGVGLLSKWSME